MSNETSERARMDAAQQQKQQAQITFDKVDAKSPYWNNRVADAQRVLDEAVAGRDAHAAKVAEAQAALTAASELYDSEAARFNAMKAEWDQTVARIEGRS